MKRRHKNPIGLKGLGVAAGIAGGAYVIAKSVEPSDNPEINNIQNFIAEHPGVTGAGIGLAWLLYELQPGK